ncbi:hypothetical protein BDK51DRAFT_29309 [Blyttiomyces helicus]|uniref:MIF4G domain-containing protein n=1 Tax=Blyttiomyces helicus TaxID=388810 RepID=A0A4P9VZ08_9FUNG|nr:hypothetical protein BDK51DRAFT_29309 [Blyttiomyces helicus]|eukprot:RKO85039.1 hypothetical protein BDK51DRAFT_29309 [Blyttiomyces helicus]
MDKVSQNFQTEIISAAEVESVVALLDCVASSRSTACLLTRDLARTLASELEPRRLDRNILASRLATSSEKLTATHMELDRVRAQCETITRDHAELGDRLKAEMEETERLRAMVDAAREESVERKGREIWAEATTSEVVLPAPQERSNTAWRKTPDTAPVASHSVGATKPEIDEDAHEKAQTATVLRRVEDLLNRLTAENLELISDQISNAGIDNTVILDAVVVLIFQKAVNEQHLSSMYAVLCAKLSVQLPKAQRVASGSDGKEV